MVSDFGEVHLEENSDNEKGVCVDGLQSVNNSVLLEKENIIFLCYLRTDVPFLICIYTLSSSSLEGLFGDM